MKHGKRELPRQRKPLLTRVLLTALVLGLAVVGVAAYLSHGSNELKNTFEVESHPVVTVSDTGITISNLSYAVYLRAAVVANWVDSSGNVLAENPNVTLDVQDGWKEINGFYYYTSWITGETQPPISLPVTVDTTAAGERTGYEIKVSIAAQAVQAVGTTDGESPVDAVFDAWAVTKEQILGTGTTG